MHVFDEITDNLEANEQNWYIACYFRSYRYNNENANETVFNLYESNSYQTICLRSVLKYIFCKTCAMTAAMLKLLQVSLP